MTTNRNEILANVKTTLAAITAADGFHQTIATVTEHLRGPNDFADDDLPALDFFPAKGGNPTPVYYPFNSIEESLDITIVGTVKLDPSAADGGDEEARRVLSELEEDVRGALAVDPTRGGWAIETVKAEHGETDEGRPMKDGVQGGIASAVWRFRCTYYPND